MPRGFVAEGRPLLDAEPVLLVDHDRTEAGEVDLLLDQGMRADGDVDRAVGEPSQNVLACAAGHPVGEQFDPQGPVAEQVAGVGHLQVAEECPHSGGVLLGEHLGRGHQRSLVTTLHRGEQHRHGDDRLPRAHVTLEEPMHRVRRGEIVVDLADHSALGPRQRIWQGVVESMHELTADRVDQPL